METTQDNRGAAIYGDAASVNRPTVINFMAMMQMALAYGVVVSAITGPLDGLMEAFR